MLSVSLNKTFPSFHHVQVTVCSKISVSDNKVCPLLATDTAPNHHRSTTKRYSLLNTARSCSLSCTSVYPSPAISSEQLEPALIRKEREREMFYLTMHSTHFIYGIRHMVKDHSDSEKGNPLPPHRLLLSINSKGYFICTIQQTG